MKWSVVKTGIAQFDILHAYGLGILLATACGEPVEMWETGCHYLLSSSVVRLPRMSCDELLRKVLPLAGEEDLQVFAHSDPEQHLPLTVLDGLLAALFTTPGSRVPSVSDLLKKQRLDAKAVQRGLHKVARCIDRWRALAGKVAYGEEADWLTHVLNDYDLEHPAHAILGVGKSDKDINVLMMIDPSCSFSLRSTLSDGRMTWKTQVTMRGTRYGALLAYLGAARFLRAQRLSGELVNCYIPIAKNITIREDTSLPVLFPTDESPDRAVIRRWLALSQEVWPSGMVWSALAYQTLLTQGQQQSLSIESGVLDSGWLMCLQERIGTGAINWWRAFLSQRRVHDEQELLLECLKRRDVDVWINYLISSSRRTNMFSENNQRRYSLEEVRMITEAMHNSEHIPLKRVLERERGTLCFGRALRQIGRYNPSRLRDLLEDLEDDGQMIMKIPARSGEYALCIRYRCVGIGADTLRWMLFVKDQELRQKRHRAILRALRDSLVSPDGALVGTMLPHLTGLQGVITVRTDVGRSPLYSALENDFIVRLSSMVDETCLAYPFESVDAFYSLMNDFIATSAPALHPFWRAS